MTKPPPPYLLSGYFGFGNIGDEAILEGLVAEIRRRNPKAAIAAISGDPAATRSRLSIDAVDFHDLDAIDKAVAGSRRVLFGLGGVFQDYWGALTTSLFREKTVGVEAYARPALLAGFHGVPAALFASGVGPLTTEAGKRFFAMACRDADALVVRDEASADVVRACGVLTPVSVGADAAYLLEASSADHETAARKLAEAGVGDAPFVAFALRAWSFDVTEEQIVAGAAKAAAGLPAGWKAVFLPFHKGAGTDDSKIAGKAAAACGARGVVVAPATPGETIALLARARAVVAMRLHAVILAAISGTPSVALAYDPKVASAALRLGLERWTLSVGDAGRLPAVLAEVLDAEEPLRARLKAGANSSRLDASASFELIEPPSEETAAKPPAPPEDLPKTLGRLAEVAASTHRQSAAQHRRIRVLARQDAAHEILAVEVDYPAREEAAQREVAEGLAEAATRSRTERERWLAELMRVRAAAWDATSKAEYRAAEIQLRENDAKAAAAALEAQLVEQKNLARHQRSLLERQLMEARLEITRFQNSRVWKAANIYWGARRRLGRLRARLTGRGGGTPHAGGRVEEPTGESPPAGLSTTLPADNKHDVLCLPIIDWDFRFQRPQQLMKRFAEAGHRVFYVAQSFRPDGPATTVAEKIPNLFEVSLRGPARNVYKDSLDGDAEHALLEGLETLRREQGIGAAAVVIQLPFWSRLAQALRRRHAWPIVYDLMDHHAGFTSNTEAMLKEEQELLAGADLVLASSAFLEVEAKKHNSRVLPLKNACDYQHFAGAAAPTPAPGARPMIGYYGAISDWFDVALVEALARRRTDWDFVLVGSTWGADVSRLEKLPNVRLPGEQPYAAIPGILASFDVAFLPFRRIPLTEATNPVKAYEILAGGKPLVAVPLPELRPMGPLVRFADTAEDFEREIAAALKGTTDSAAADARRAYAKEHTWEARFAALAPAVAQSFPKASVVIVTFHNKDLNRLCLESVSARTEWPNMEVIVVDNGSTDGTPEMLRERQARHPELRVLVNGENRGFAAAVNQGLAQASGDYLVLLNNDTVVARGWLSRLIGHLSADPALGLVGPRTNAISNEQRLDPGYTTVEEMPAFAARLARENDRELFDLPMIAMFCVAMRRTVFETVGPLDERFAVGMFEDDDYCRRVRQQGLRIAVARDVYLHHWQRASFRLLGEQEYQRVFEENRRRYEEKWGAWVRPAGSAPPPEGRLKRQLEEVVARAAGKRGTVVFLPSIGWDIHLFQRPHHLARAFARRGWVAVFDCSNSSSDAVDGFKEIEPDLFLYRGPEGVLSRIPDVLLWAFPYNFELADGYPSGSRSVYDWIDDLDVFPQSRELLERNHARGLAEATVVASVARRLHEQALATRPDATYLPNGVEYERFAEENPPRPNDPALEPLISRGAPIAGYYGALARWFDYDLLDSVAQRRPDWSFLLIGPNHDGSAKGQRVFRHGNVHWLGPRDYAALPGYLALFDVATIPFAINPITTATSPLKLFEYFAGAKPVVTTPMPECAAYPEVRVAANAEAFAAALDGARESGKDPAFRERLRQLGREGSWDARVDAVLAALETAPGAPARAAMTAPAPAPMTAPAATPELPAQTPPSPPPPAQAVLAVEDEPEPEPTAPPPAAVAAVHAPSGSNGLVGPPDPVDLPGPFGMHAIGGRCLVCGRETDFVYDDPNAWREQLACLLCRTTSRYRSIARGLLEAIREITGIEAASLAELPREKAGPALAIYDTQLPFAHMASAYPVPDMLRRCSWIELELSTWKRRKKLGRRLGPRTTNQNLERLTFADGSFDIVITSDVMEHVRLEDRAHREIYRILRPGGFYVFTVPHLRDRETIVRVQITDPEDPSKDRHLLEPEYHGDANDSEGSVLAYRNFGIDLDRNLEALGFDVSYHRSDLERFGILGTELFLARRRVGSP